MKKYIYISGFGRSGSSIFEYSLSKNIKSISIGELSLFLERAVIDREICSCGKGCVDCVFWESTIDSLLKNFTYQEICRIKDKQNIAESTFGFYKSGYKNIDPDLERYYRFILSKVFEKYDVVIDSSKRPVVPLILERFLPEKVELIDIFFVRRGAAVAYSWTKPKERLEASRGVRKKMHSFSFSKAYFKWINSMIVTLLSKYNRNLYVVEYEAFTRDPDRVLNDLIFTTGLQKYKGAGDYHSVAGNPSRFSFGSISEDIRWKSAFNSFQRFLFWSVERPFYFFLKIFNKI